MPGRPGDPSIPRGGPAPVRGPIYGRFVDYGDFVVLKDRNENRYAIETVSIESGSFGNPDDGVEHLPRPWVFDESGREVVKGDWVIIDFLDGSSMRPVVRGGIRPLTRDSFLARSYKDLAKTDTLGRLRARIRPRTRAGEVTGEARLLVCDNGKGEIDILGTDSITLDIGPDLESAPGTRLTVEIDREKVVISKGGAPLKLVMEDLLPDLLAGLAELMAFANGLGVPTPNLLALTQKLPTMYRTNRLKSE